jgi:hypothetical protein
MHGGCNVKSSLVFMTLCSFNKNALS